MRRATKEEHSTHAQAIREIRKIADEIDNDFRYNRISKSAFKRLKAEAQRKEFQYMEEHQLYVLFGSIYLRND